VLVANALGYCAVVQNFMINSLYVFIFEETIIPLALGIECINIHFSPRYATYCSGLLQEQ
jgi:hypothetical protein